MSLSLRNLQFYSLFTFILFEVSHAIFYVMFETSEGLNLPTGPLSAFYFPTYANL